MTLFFQIKDIYALSDILVSTHQLSNEEDVVQTKLGCAVAVSREGRRKKNQYKEKKSNFTV